MDITVTMLNGRSHKLRVDPQDKVGSMKKSIEHLFNVPVIKQKLVFVNGQKTTLTDDSKRVCDYGLQPGSQVSLLIIEPPTIQVFLRNEKGQVSPYDIKPEETVSDFKTKVQLREGVPATQQRLLHQSREMTTGKLSDYGVEAHSNIELMLRLRGG
ncbi:uncharacterized protein V6R79_017875 [Siganus canaliculatus]